MEETVSSRSRLDRLIEFRNHYSVKPTYRSDGSIGAKEWSKQMLIRPSSLPRPLEEERGSLSDYSDWQPRNLPLLEFIKERFAWCGFDWERVVVEGRTRKGAAVFRCSLRFKNYPTVHGFMPTLFDLAVMLIELADQWPGNSFPRPQIGHPSYERGRNEKEKS